MLVGLPIKLFSGGGGEILPAAAGELSLMFFPHKAEAEGFEPSMPVKA